MKIAILTLPLNDNYGGILQAYALREYLIRKGHLVYHIEEKEKRSIVHWSSLRYNTWCYIKTVIQQIISFNRDSKRRDENRIRRKLRKDTRGIRRFVKENFKIMVVNDFKLLERENFDAIVVGSDQIWRPLYYKPIENAFLAFAEGWRLKKIAYAPSFGTEQWEYSEAEVKICRCLINQFGAVSIREDRGVKLCKEKFSIEVLRLIDPTMLLSKHSYESLLGVDVQTQSRQLTTYILDKSDHKEKIVNKLVEENGLKRVELGLSDSEIVGISESHSLEFWLTHFMQAEFIFTDSFHGCVFAILFHKPFIAFGNKDRGMSRFNTLLHLFELEDRMLLSGQEIGGLYNEEINWSRVDGILNSEREIVESFFQKVGI